MRRALWAAVAVVVAAVGVLAAYTASDPGDCTVERLPLPAPGAYTLVFAMDPAGSHVVGRTGAGSGDSRLDLVIWTDGRPRRAGLPGDGSPVPEGVNAAGVVVGTTTVGSTGGPTELRGWMYRDGAATLLPLSEASAVSDDGVVVGADRGRPVVWRPSDAASTPLAADGHTGRATGVTPDGRTIVGVLRTGNRMLPYVWSADGSPRELPMPTVDGEPAMDASAESVTGDWVVGLATTRRGDRDVPVRWNLRTGEVTVFPRYDLGGAAVSGDGVLTAKDHRRAVLLGARRTLTLRRLDDSSALPDTAEAVSPDGRRVAGNAASVRAGGTAPVVWRCAA
jgi:hypothetical protein